MALLLGFSPASFAGADPNGEPNAGQLKVFRSRITGLTSFVTAPDRRSPIPVTPAPGSTRVKAGDFFTRHGRLFGVTRPDRQLVADGVRTDRFGWTHTTFRQVHEGLEVFGGVLRVHQKPDGSIYAVNGDFYPISPKLKIAPALTAEQAARNARQSFAKNAPVVEHSRLVVVNPGWYGDPDLGVHLAYYLILTDPNAAVREAFFVDAHDGAILDHWNLIDTAIDREIHDAGGTNSIPGPLARSEGEPPTGEPDVDAAYDYSGDLYDYYALAFGRDGYDDAGATQIVTVNYTNGSYCPNASWNGVQTRFCTGIATDDVVAHEWGHALTDFTANLIYQNQSGQLNESYSDVFGEMVDLFNGGAAFAGEPEGTSWADHETGSGLDAPNNLRTQCSPGLSYPDGVRWLIGEDTSFSSGAIRDMWDPPCHGHPDRANSPLQTCPAGDGGGVHSGSGIPNHAFAMLVDGKSFRGFTIGAIGPIKAGAVWFRALAFYLTPASDFEDAFAGLNQAAADLVGTFPDDPRTGSPSNSMFTQSDADQVNNSLLAVEMNTPGACGQGNDVLNPDPATLCPDRVTVFADDFETGAPGWSVSNTNPPTPYNWVLTGEPLPFDRPGIAWFADDPFDLGDCNQIIEAAVHSLDSPAIMLPETTDVFMFTFTHLAATEGAYDGGNLKISLNNGPWQVVPRSAFQFNPYNGKLRSAGQGNDNPMADQPAFNGAGGSWGTSIVSLDGLASSGDQLRVRFDLGKDGCNGVFGWLVDDFELFACPDCDIDGTTDQREFNHVSVSEALEDIGDDSEVIFTLPTPPLAAGDVTLRFTAYADLGEPGEYLEVAINGFSLGNILETGASNCPFTPDSHAQIVLTAAEFNTAVAGGDAEITLVGSNSVNPNFCGGSSYVTVIVEYETTAEDVNDNNIPDLCEFGACCNGDGSCNGDQEENACLSGGGIYQGNGSTCAQAGCTAFGACCMGDGTCNGQQTVVECATLGGLYQGNTTSCALLECERFGACCFGDGGCQSQITAAECSIADGKYQGYGSDCLSSECSVGTGACCMGDFSCDEGQSADQCGAVGGQYLGDNTSCSLCSPAAGACCDVITGECVGEFPATECAEMGYDPQDPGSTCASITCPVVTGACCLDDGSCLGDQTIADCEAVNGAFQGEDLSRGEANCPQPEGTGACCLAEGGCLANQTEAACTTIGGSYGGDNVSCAAAECPDPDPTGACCTNTSSCSQDQTAEDCAGVGGVYLGNGSDCTNCSPFPQACCAGITGECDDRPPSLCIAEGLDPQGEGTDCATDGCPTPLGACCFESGFCLFVSDDDCSDLAGIWQGGGTPCGQADCGVTGACCLGDGSCLEVSSDACADLAGTYSGDGSSCGTTECGEPTGACCLAGGECSDDQTAEVCNAVGGAYQGDGSDCASAGCVAADGACCFATGFCLFLPESDCADLAGSWQGSGLLCSAVDCGTTGACCLDSESCLDITVEACATLNGSYAGDDTTCESESCSASCPADFNGDGVVGPFDLATILGNWGPCPGCPMDFNDDGVVGPFDLATLLGQWGPCD